MSKPVHLKDVRVTYSRSAGALPAVDAFTLTVPAGAVGCLLGPSGCGKTSVLRAIAGFEPLVQGAILLGDTLLSSPGLHIPPERRRVGMVFQEGALFPHLTVAGNIAYGLHRQPLSEQRKHVQSLLELIAMPGFGERYPHEISGGQQQRVALARALAPAPSVLLLDEPFSSLDSSTRQRLSRDVRDIIKASGQTAMLVTHDEHEAARMADHIGTMRAGRLVDWAANGSVPGEVATETLN